MLDLQACRAGQPGHPTPQRGQAHSSSVSAHSSSEQCFTGAGLSDGPLGSPRLVAPCPGVLRALVCRFGNLHVDSLLQCVGPQNQWPGGTPHNTAECRYTLHSTHKPIHNTLLEQPLLLSYHWGMEPQEEGVVCKATDARGCNPCSRARANLADKFSGG